jgi:branched-chain amino acid transport system ATP-binding protein
MSLLEIDRLEARHGLLLAVRSLTLQVAEGEIVAVVGSNGAGKTTLFRTIAGAHSAAAGSIRFAGQDITRSEAHKRVGMGIALVPEGRHLFASMTVKENLQLAGEYGRRGCWTLERVFDAFPALKPFAKSLAGNLSGGQRQAVAIGRALMSNPRILLLDEVSLGLSPVAVEGLYESLGSLKLERSTTMVIVEQDLKRAQAFADRIICMLEGQIALEGKSAHLAKDDIAKAYFGLDQAAGEPSLCH